jgi:Fe-S cluster assembly scaffold protein SufB
MNQGSYTDHQSCNFNIWADPTLALGDEAVDEIYYWVDSESGKIEVWNNGTALATDYNEKIKPLITNTCEEVTDPEAEKEQTP